MQILFIGLEVYAVEIFIIREVEFILKFESVYMRNGPPYRDMGNLNRTFKKYYISIYQIQIHQLE